MLVVFCNLPPFSQHILSNYSIKNCVWHPSHPGMRTGPLSPGDADGPPLTHPGIWTGPPPPRSQRGGWERVHPGGAGLAASTRGWTPAGQGLAWWTALSSVLDRRGSERMLCRATSYFPPSLSLVGRGLLISTTYVNTKLEYGDFDSQIWK